MTTHAIISLSNSHDTRITPNGVHSGIDITIQNLDSSVNVYLGGEGVTSSNFGYKLLPDSAIAFELSGADALYAISDGNGSQLAILKTSLEIGA